jgi:hypothetical protein
VNIVDPGDMPGNGDDDEATAAGAAVRRHGGREAPDSEVRSSQTPPNHHVAYLLAGVTVFGAIGVPVALMALIRANRRGRSASSFSSRRRSSERRVFGRGRAGHPEDASGPAR